MIIDGHSVPDGTSISCDVCIVGSGPAGLSLALRLARESRIAVCVLESGGLGFEEPSQELARGETLGLPYYPLHETRIRALGGSTLSWGGVCTPLDELAFEDRPWVPNAGWPFPRATLDQYLDDALALCEITPDARRLAEAAVERRAKAAGLDGTAVTATPVFFSPPTRFGRAHRDRIRTARNLDLYLHSTTTGLETNEDGSGVTGLQVRCLSGTGFRVAARSYVLAAGGVENPRILLVSAGERGGGIGNDHGNVGRYFMEHPRAVNRYRIRPGDTPLGRLIGGGAAGTLRFFRMSLGSDIQRREELLNCHANLQFGYVGQLSRQWEAARRLAIAARPPWNESPYFQDRGGGRMGIRAGDLATALRRPDLSLASVLGAVTQRPSMRRFLTITSSTEQVPDRDNRVEHAGERDALGVPKVRIAWKVGETEERTYRRWLQILLGELEKLEPGLASAALPDPDPWPSQLVGTWHHIGSTRMHSDPVRGVVDGDCRVHGMDNLFIAGSSVFPVSGSMAPTVTIIQLSLRLGEHLARRLG